ncbi:hypothetical protein TURU_122189 [Turdus rufiventris]|nr:hypothetical protein TURU_122189 [Turdus rufiventris]
MQKKINYCNKEEIKYVEMKISIHGTVPCIAINNKIPGLQKKMQTLGRLLQETDAGTGHYNLYSAREQPTMTKHQVPPTNSPLANIHFDQAQKLLSRVSGGVLGFSVSDDGREADQGIFGPTLTLGKAEGGVEQRGQ